MKLHLHSCGNHCLHCSIHELLKMFGIENCSRDELGESVNYILVLVYARGDDNTLLVFVDCFMFGV